MPSSNTTQQQQSTASQTAPWSAAQPALTSILGSLGTPSAAATPDQSNAASLLQTEANATPSYAAPGEAAVTNLFNSSTTPQQGMLTSSLGQLQNTLNPETQASYLNPMTAPGMGAALQQLNQNITGQVNGQFAAAGRDLSPDNSKALATGLSQGEGQLLTNEFNTLQNNQNNAATTLNSAAGNTAAGITGQQQTALGNETSGITQAGNIPGLLTAPGATELTAANTAYGVPYSNATTAEGAVNPIASLGSQSTGTSSGTTTQDQSAIGNILSGLIGAGTIASKFATASDERVKENKKPIGMLFDGTPVHSYNYKGDHVPRIGLLAQEVERRHPEAVSMHPSGIKMVDHDKASKQSQIMGMLHRRAA